MNREEVTIQVARTDRESGGGIGFFISVADTTVQRYGTSLIPAVMAEVQQQLVKQFIEQHGAAILENLAPGAIGDSIHSKLSAEIAKKVLG